MRQIGPDKAHDRGVSDELLFGVRVFHSHLRPDRAPGERRLTKRNLNRLGQMLLIIIGLSNVPEPHRVSIEPQGPDCQYVRSGTAKPPAERKRLSP